MEFSQDELIKATNAFGDANLIGEGGFGRVFRAHDLRCAGTDAAVKVLSEVSWPDVFYTAILSRCIIIFILTYTEWI